MIDLFCAIDCDDLQTWRAKRATVIFVDPQPNNLNNQTNSANQVALGVVGSVGSMMKKINNEVWEVRFRWSQIKPQVQRQLLEGEYSFSPLRRIHRGGEDLEIWSALGLFYVRFMDDWVVLAPTRWKLRKAVRVVNETLAQLEVTQHPDKTFVGRVRLGFAFLGYEFDSDGLAGIAEPTRLRFIERVHQLYEQGATRSRIGDYIRRWLIWVTGGLGNIATWFCVAGGMLGFL